MKLLSIVIVFLFSGVCYGQQTWTSMPLMSCNKICITTADSPNVAYKNLVMALVQYGYGIDNKDSDMLIVNTKPKGYRSVNTEINAYVLVGSDSTRIYVTGSYTTISIGFYGAGLSTSDGYLKSPISKGGMNGSIVNDSWKEMYNVSQIIPGSKSYLKPN